MISRHFSRAEMACSCGCGLDTMDVETLKIADECRDFAGHSITPSSAARCMDHNRAIRSKDDSQHVKCRALDLPVREPKELYKFLCNRYPNQYGFGLYNSFVHVDTKSGGARRWEVSAANGTKTS